MRRLGGETGEPLARSFRGLWLRLSLKGSLILLAPISLFIGCGGAKARPEEPAAKEPVDQPLPSASEPADSSPSPDPHSKAPAEGVPDEAGPKPTEVVAQICEDNCIKVEKSCNQRTADFCRASCRDYVFGAEECPVEIAEALRCQNTAEDFLLCSNISAPSCAELYRSLDACRTGKVAPQVWGAEKAPVVEGGLPAGWESLQEPSFGFSHLLPTGFSLQKTEDGFRASGVAADGGNYTLQGTRLGESRATDLKIMNTALKFLPKDCGADLRLHGQFESKGVKHVRFDAPCKSGGGYRGFLHVWEAKILIASGQFATLNLSEELSPLLETFLFSFERATPAASE